MSVHVHAPATVAMRLERMPCPTCKRRVFFVAGFQNWYGWHATCLRCGEEWQDGEMLPRPFMPRWREVNKQRARARWRQYRKRFAGATIQEPARAGAATWKVAELMELADTLGAQP